MKWRESEKFIADMKEQQLTRRKLVKRTYHESRKKGKTVLGSMKEARRIEKIGTVLGKK